MSGPNKHVKWARTTKNNFSLFGNVNEAARPWTNTP